MGGSNKASILHWPPDVSTIGDGAATVDSQDTVPSSSTGVSLKNPPSAGSDPIVLFQLYHAKLTDLDNAPMVHMRLSQLLDPAYLDQFVSRCWSKFFLHPCSLLFRILSIS